MVGQYYPLNGSEFEQIPGDSERQGSLACCSPWGHKELNMTWPLNNSNNTRIIVFKSKLDKVLCGVLSCSVMSDSLQCHELQPIRLLCPWGFSRQEYWNGLPCKPPGHFPNLGIKPSFPTLQADSLPSEPLGTPSLTKSVPQKGSGVRNGHCLVY